MASNQLEVAALGRPFALGMLYDAQRDALIPGLWDDKTLREKTIRSFKPSNEFVITESDSIESKFFLLDVNASLKASFLSGLIEVEGSAKYLKDHKEFKNQSRVTGQYNSTTHMEQLSMTDLMTLKYHQKDVINKSSATHIVTGILYGANAFFVFDSEKLDSSVEEIAGSMKAVIKKIPSFGVEGKVDLKMTEEEKALSDSISCKFFGDFNLQSIPLTYEDAVKTIGQLPQLLGENGEKAVPMKVWLMPLTNLYPEAAELKSEISDGLVGKMLDAFEDLREIQMRSNESLKDRVVQNFPRIKEELDTFQKLCHLYTSNLQGTMKEKLPSIREGKEDESSLEKTIDNRNKSPFSQEKLIKWLDDKEREINVIRSCVETMKGTKIVKNQSELDREVLAADVDDAFCFVFTSTKQGDTYLDEMATYLDSPRMGSTTEDEWFYADEVLTSMRQKAKAFQDFTKTQKNNNRIRFLIAVIPTEKYEGATIYHYKQGILVSEDFSGPDLHLDPENITDRRVLMNYARDLTLDPNTVNNHLVLSDGNKKVTHGSKDNQYPVNKDRFDAQPQVLCQEGLSGHNYWEVESNSDSKSLEIRVAAAYKTIDRKGTGSKFGGNKQSWALSQIKLDEKCSFSAWHDGKETKITFSSGGSSTLGVYLVCNRPEDNSTLSFYTVSSNTVKHIYTFRTTFNEPLYSGFRVVYDNNFAKLGTLE